MISKAVDIEPMNGAYLDSLGWVYFKMGEYELAEDNLRQAVNRDQTDPTVHMHLGDLYEKTGRIRLAAAQWQLSLDEFAKSSPADIEPSDVAKVQKKLESARVKLAKEEGADWTRPNRSRRGRSCDAAASRADACRRAVKCNAGNFDWAQSCRA